MKDRSLLEELLRKKHINRASLARDLGISQSCFGNKIHGHNNFNVKEAYMLCKALEIDLEDIVKYFG